MSIPSNIAITFRVLFGRLFTHVCSPNCAFPGKLWCGLQLWTSNKQNVVWTRNAPTRGKSWCRVRGTLAAGGVEVMAFEAKEKCHQVPRDAFVHVCVYMSVCDLLQSSTSQSQHRYNDLVLSLSLSCHSPPLCLPLIFLLKTNSLHIVLSAETMSCPWRRFWWE